MTFVPRIAGAGRPASPGTPVSSDSPLAMIAGGNGGEIQSSPDSINWTQQRSSETPFDVARGIAFGVGRWVVAGDDGWIATAEASDPSTWVNRANDGSYGGGGGQEYFSAWYGNGLFFIGGRPDITGGMQRSADGITWTQFTLPGDPLIQVKGGIWVETLGLHVCVGGNAGAGSGKIFTSPDGITWTERTADNAGTANNFTSIGWDETIGLLCTTGIGSVELQTSSDGINWTTRTPASEGGSGSLHEVAGNNSGLFVLVGGSSSDPLIQTSVDGINWISRTGDFPGVYISPFFTVSWSLHHNLWIIAGRFGEFQSSPDGINWTRRAHAGSFNDSMLCSIGRAA